MEFFFLLFYLFNYLSVDQFTPFANIIGTSLEKSLESNKKKKKEIHKELQDYF